MAIWYVYSYNVLQCDSMVCMQLYSVLLSRAFRFTYSYTVLLYIRIVCIQLHRVLVCQYDLHTIMQCYNNNMVCIRNCELCYSFQSISIKLVQRLKGASLLYEPKLPSFPTKKSQHNNEIKQHLQKMYKAFAQMGVYNETDFNLE